MAEDVAAARTPRDTFDASNKVKGWRKEVPVLLHRVLNVFFHTMLLVVSILFLHKLSTIVFATDQATGAVKGMAPQDNELRQTRRDSISPSSLRYLSAATYECSSCTPHTLSPSSRAYFTNG